MELSSQLNHDLRCLFALHKFRVDLLVMLAEAVDFGIDKSNIDRRICILSRLIFIR